MADVIFNSFKAKLLNGAGIDLDTDTIKVALVTSSYTADQDTHDFFDDVTNEISATGYTAGGYTLLSPTVTQDNTDNEGVFDAADPTWTITTAVTNLRGAVIYKSTGTASTSPLICYLDFGSNYTFTNATFTIAFAAEGILNLT